MTTIANTIAADNATRTQHLKHWLEINGFEENGEGGYRTLLAFGRYADHLVTVRNSTAGLPLEFGRDIEVEVRDMDEDTLDTITLEFSTGLAGEDGRNNLAGYAYNYNDVAITDAFVTECSRFRIDPENYYGMPKIVAQLLTNLNDIAQHVFRFGRNYEATVAARKQRQRAARADVKRYGEVPAYPLQAWRSAVADGATTLGYSDWVVAQVSAE